MDDIRQIRDNLAADNFQKIHAILTEKCFARCCQNTNGHLSESEKKCLSNCHAAYFQAINVVAEQINRLNSKAQER